MDPMSSVSRKKVQGRISILKRYTKHYVETTLVMAQRMKTGSATIENTLGLRRPLSVTTGDSVYIP